MLSLFKKFFTKVGSWLTSIGDSFEGHYFQLPIKKMIKRAIGVCEFYGTAAAICTKIKNDVAKLIIILGTIISGAFALLR